MHASTLQKLTSPHGKYLDDEVSGLPVYHVTNPHLFVQAAGYLKHTVTQSGRSSVLFRGQSKLYPAMHPSLYRGIATQAGKQSRDSRLNDYLTKIQSGQRVLRNVKQFAREPLLQHYGIRTRWIDVVDNAWVALWFACHDVLATGRLKEYLHFERRTRPYSSSEKAYAYILLIHVGMEASDPTRPGLYSGGDTEVVDLRVAVSSTFVRPHAQHGLLFRRCKQADHNHLDYADFVVGTLRVEIGDALDWLGSGSLLNVHTLFPPATYDFGYRELLQGAPPGSGVLGAIHHVGA